MLKDQEVRSSERSELRFKDEVGNVFGRLTVLKREYLPRTGTMRCRAIFRCKCSCGNELSVSGNLLRAGKFRECGTCAQAWEK